MHIMKSKQVGKVSGLVDSRPLVEALAGQWTMPGLAPSTCQGNSLSMVRMVRAQQVPSK